MIDYLTEPMTLPFWWLLLCIGGSGFMGSVAGNLLGRRNGKRDYIRFLKRGNDA